MLFHALQTAVHYRCAILHAKTFPDKGSGSPSAHHVFIRGAIALHNLASNGQHRSPVCDLKAEPCLYAYEQAHEESQWTAQAVRNDPLRTQLANAANAKTALLPDKAPRNNHTPDLDQPIPFRTSLPGPSDTEEMRGRGRRVTISAHPGMISTTCEIDRLGFPSRPAHVLTCNLPSACCREASFSTAGHQT